MDNSALPFPPSLKGTGLRSGPSGQRPFVVKPASREPDPVEVIATIRRQIASHQQTPGAILNAIAVVAQALTGATGAAIAIVQHGPAVCVARSGETAPELGDRLDLGAGISGECMRAGRILLCDDTQLDPRVDAEVCRQLGLRSIAVVPIRENGEAVGLLEVFSVYAYAFSQQHMNLLGSLGELVESARAQEAVEIYVEPPPPPAAPAPLENVAPEYPLEEALRRLPALSLLEQKRPRWIIAAAAFAIVVVVVTFWQIFHHSEPAAAPAVQAAAAQPSVVQPAPAPDASTANVTEPPREEVRHERALSEKRTSRHHRKQEEVPDVIIRRESAAIDDRDSLSVANGRIAAPAPAPVDDDSLSAPQIPITGGKSAGLGALLSANIQAPRLGAPISHGVSAATLKREVPPVYPSVARSMHVQGVVVLQIVVREDGSVAIDKVISGSPALAPAAVEAVKKWRYNPATLNGKPIEVRTQVTIHFRLG